MIRKAIRRMSRMCGEAWYIFMGTLKLSCAMLFCAFLLLISSSSYDQTMLAAALAETPQGLLMIALIASALLEERHG